MNKAYRIAFFTKHKRRTLFTTSIIRALQRNGCVIRRINMAAIRRKCGHKLAHHLARHCVTRFRPDAIIIFSGDIQEETLAHFRGRVKTAILLDDYFALNHRVTQKILQVDVFFHTMTGQLEAYRSAGVRQAVHAHRGVDPDFHRKSEPHQPFLSKLAFIGTATYPDRIDLITTLHRETDIKIYGLGWDRLGISAVRKSIAVRDFARVCASADVMIGIDVASDQELCFSNRTWFVLGCGGFLVTRYVPGLEKLFANHRHLVWFHDKEEALDEIQFYLRHERARKRIAQEGHDFVHRHYRFDRMATNLVRVLFEGKDPMPLTDPGPSGERGATTERTPVSIPPSAVPTQEVV